MLRDAYLNAAFQTGLANPLDDAIVVSGPDGHHLQRVRRLRAGEQVTAADGAGHWRCYEIEAVEPGRLHLVARGARTTEPQLVPAVCLAVALTKAGAEAANYPFTTIEPNVAVVPVGDERLEQVAATVGAITRPIEAMPFSRTTTPA